jgi:hypothetical protein
MMDAAAQLREEGIVLKDTRPGRHYTTCPKCSAKRKGAHQHFKVLGVTVEHDGAHWGCNHCGWTGAVKTGKPNGAGKPDPNIYYDYADENGELLFQKVRFPNKDFRQRKPDGKGGWIWKLGDTRKVIYRLPQVNEAISAGYSIVCVEGEKDADNLWKIGVPATCNPDGAAEPGQKPKWRPEYSEMLRGADIVVMGDHDDAGRAHAEATAKACTGIAARVRMLDIARHWSDCPKGGDVSDWLKAGHTREQLDALVGKAPDFGKTPDAPKIVLTLPEFLAGFIRPDYLVDGLMQRHFFYSLTGNTGDGKTAIALLLAAYVAMGGQRLGTHEVEHGRVVYIAKENATDIRMRLIGMAFKIGFDRNALANDFLVIEQLDSLEKDMPRIAKEVEAFGQVALVVIDTSAATFPGDDENNNPQMIAHAKMQRRFCDLPGRPCVLALCHPPKNASSKEQLVPRGGGAYLNETDGNLTALGHGEKLSDLHWTGKFRGPDFEKITFRFSTVYTTELSDAKGRVLPTVMAEVVTDEQAAENEEKAVFQENRLLAAMVAKPHGSLTTWAEHCGWTLPAKPGEFAKPNKALTQRVMRRLIDGKLVRKSGRSYELTKDGIKTVQSPAEDAA